MPVHVLRRRQHLDAPPEDVFAFFAAAENLEAITPDLLRFRILTPEGGRGIREGTLLQYRLHLHRVPMRWTTLITAFEAPHRFVDTQLSGPFRLWHHEHRFTADDATGGTWMEDVVSYDVGRGPIGRLARRVLVARDLEAIFDFRAREIPRLVAAHRARPGTAAPAPGARARSPA